MKRLQQLAITAQLLMFVICWDPHMHFRCGTIVPAMCVVFPQSPTVLGAVSCLRV